MSPDYSKRDYLLPQGCKDLIDLINLQKEKPPLPWHAAKYDAEMSKAEFEKQAKLASAYLPPITGEIVVSGPTSAADLATLLCQEPFKIIADLLELAAFVNVNQPLNFATVCKVARRYGYAAKKQA